MISSKHRPLGQVSHQVWDSLAYFKWRYLATSHQRRSDRSRRCVKTHETGGASVFMTAASRCAHFRLHFDPMGKKTSILSVGVCFCLLPTFSFLGRIFSMNDGGTVFSHASKRLKPSCGLLAHRTFGVAGSSGCWTDIYDYARCCEQRHGLYILPSSSTATAACLSMPRPSRSLVLLPSKLQASSMIWRWLTERSF